MKYAFSTLACPAWSIEQVVKVSLLVEIYMWYTVLVE